MAEIEIKTLDDLRKLEGWLITKAQFISGTATLELELKHIAAEHKIRFLVTAVVTLETRADGSIIMYRSIPALAMRSVDVIEENLTAPDIKE